MNFLRSVGKIRVKLELNFKIQQRLQAELWTEGDHKVNFLHRLGWQCWRFAA